MVNKKFGINALSEALEEKDIDGSSVDSSRSIKKISSPINSPAMSKRPNRIQRMYMDLPVSKERVECELIEVEPEQCLVSNLNKRVQSLLSPSDPTIKQLKQHIDEDKQRDPVLLRPLDNADGKVIYELVYGSRRRYVVNLLRDEGQKDLKLKAWLVKNINDADAKKLADSENDDRQDISAWEIAKYYEKLKTENKALTADVIAVNEGSTVSSVRRYLQLATLPEVLVKHVVSPTEISLRSGLEILKILNVLKPEKYTQLVDTIIQCGVFDTGANLLKEIKNLSNEKAPSLSKKKALKLKNSSGDIRAVIGSHRTNVKQYKIDLYDMNKQDLDKVIDVLKNILKI